MLMLQPIFESQQGLSKGQVDPTLEKPLFFCSIELGTSFVMLHNIC